MTKAERASIVLKILCDHYPETPVPLDHNDNFTLLVAVLLSAQCTDERVNKVTPKLFKLANNAKDMRTKSPEKILKLSSHVGLDLKNPKQFTNYLIFCVISMMERFQMI